VIAFNRSVVLFYGLAAYYVYYIFENVFVRSLNVRTSLIDELAAAALVCLAVLSGPPRRAISPAALTAIAGICIFLASSVLSTMFSHIEGFPKVNAMRAGLLIDLKPLVAFVAIYLILHPSREWRGVRVLFGVLFAIALANSAFVLRDIAMGGTNLYGDPLMVRAGVPLATGLFHHKVESVQMTLLGLAGGLGLVFFRPAQMRWRPALAAGCAWLGFIALAHLSVKEIFAVALVALLIPYATPNLGVGVKMLGAAVILLLGGLLVAYGPPTIIAAVDDRVTGFTTGGVSDQTVRERSYEAAFEIAADNFPLGVGAGAYLSAPSRKPVFSPVYHQYGLSKLDGGRPENPIYLLDTFWPKILGESGWLGLAGYVLFYGGLLAAAARWWLADQGGAGLAAVVVLTSALISSIADSTPPNERFALMIGLSGALGMLGREMQVRGLAAPGAAPVASSARRLNRRQSGERRHEARAGA